MQSVESLYVVDDDDTYQFIIERTIEKTGMVKLVRIFSNGQQAITFLESIIDTPALLPDIILLDISMPVMDGWGFLENFILLKPRAGKKIHIYIVSSSINPVDFQRAKSFGEVSDYIVKPVTSEKLVSMLKTLPQSG